MADARQKEMNVSITVVATNTFTAGRFRLSMGDDIRDERRYVRLEIYHSGGDFRLAGKLNHFMGAI